MFHGARNRSLRVILAGLMAAAMGGCPMPSRDARDENHPLLKRAAALKRSGSIDGAIAAYLHALDKNPSLARAHLDLALIYDQPPKEDYLLAAYHYDRYLAARPKEAKRPQIEELARRARLSFAASLPARPSEAVQMIADLRTENQMLRNQIEKQQQMIAEIQKRASPAVGAGDGRSRATATDATAAGAGGRARTASAGAPASGAGTSTAGSLKPPTPAPAVAHTRTYTVQSGDTLSIISSRVYNDGSAWRKIFEANKGILPQPGSLRPGQVLVIPP